MIRVGKTVMQIKRTSKLGKLKNVAKKVVLERVHFLQMQIIAFDQIINHFSSVSAATKLDQNTFIKAS